MEDVAYLAKEDKSRIQSSFVKSMSSFIHMAAFCKAVSSDWLWIVQLVAGLGADGALELCQLARRRTVESKPDLWFSTVHTSKGLEFDNVVLGEDFPKLAMPCVTRDYSSEPLYEPLYREQSGRLRGSSMFTLSLRYVCPIQQGTGFR